MIGLYKIGVSIVLVFFSLFGTAATRFAFRAGCSLSCGTHSCRAGIFGMAHCAADIAQAGMRLDFFSVARAWGHSRRGWESQLSTNAGLGYGRYLHDAGMYLDISSSIMPYRNFLGFTYIWYRDSYMSSQSSGAVAFQCGKLRMITENDFFGSGHSDKHRTAGGFISFINDTVELGIKLVLWTGDGFGKGTVRVTDSDYPARFGYRDISRTRHGRHSVGALGIQVRTDRYLGQTLSLYAGADAEQFRNIFQNKFMHDLWFIPERMIHYKMMHYPMLDPYGLSRLTPEQNVRSPRPLFQAGVNEPSFY